MQGPRAAGKQVRGVDESDMSERLGKIAELAFGPWIVFLGKKTQVVA